jgi:hypothetical protein
MDETKLVAGDGRTAYYGSMAADSLIQRLDAYPVREATSKFGVRGF